MSPLDEMRDEALEAWEAARKEHVPFIMWAKMGSWFDDLRSEPRFKEIMSRLG